MNIMLAQIKKESRIAIVVLFAGIMSFGQVRANANLTVQTSEMGFYSLEMNGQFIDFNQNVYTLPNVMPGVHNVRLHKWVQGFGNQGNWNVVFQSLVHVLPMHNTVIMYNAWGGTTVQHHPIAGTPNMPFPNPGGPGGVGAPGMPGGGFAMGMAPMVFDQFIAQMDNMSFDSNKVEYAKFAIRQNGITVAQLKIALGRLSFDSNRLDLAKYAYPFTIDRQNYFLLQDAFSFQSNFRALMSSI
jgi:hypothetical protein